MIEEKKKRLFPYFAYLYSKQLNPDKYGAAKTMEEWSSLIQNNKQDVETITKAAAKLTDKDWDDLEKEYEKEQQEGQQQQAQYAAKGTKLKQLKEKASTREKAVAKDPNKSVPKKETKAAQKSIDDVPEPKVKPAKTTPQLKKGSTVKKRKCSCGCNLVLTKGEGGKITEKCACNCKGGKIKK